MWFVKRVAWVLLTIIVFAAFKEPHFPAWVGGAALGFWAAVTGAALWPATRNEEKEAD